MDITLFICSLSSGGAEHQITLLGNFLVEKGYNVNIVNFSSTTPHYALNPKIKRIVLGGKSRLATFLSIFNYFFTIKSKCVISFGARENSLCLLPLIFRPKVKVLAGERCASFQQMPMYKKINYKLLYRRANFIVPNSYSQREEILSIAPKYANKTIAITNYTDPTEYTVRECVRNNTIRIGIFCRYSEQKNYARFADALSILKGMTKKTFHVDWYGKSHNDSGVIKDFTIFSELIKERGISDVITLHDQTDNVSQLIPTFDAMCLPSIGEGFSNSISEYICCGKPVICSDVADNSVMVHNGVNGFLFNPYNVTEMARTFVDFFDLSDDEKARMGIESRKLAEQLFNKEHFVNQYIKLIES